MFHISEAAEQELRNFVADDLEPGEFLRISRAYQCGASRFQIEVDTTRTPMDETILLNGLELVVETSCLELLDGCDLDWNQEGFVFLDPNHQPC